MECVTMKHRGMQFLSLEVPGLAERRPSLVYGDYIFARPAYQDASGMKPYQVLCAYKYIPFLLWLFKDSLSV